MCDLSLLLGGALEKGGRGGFEIDSTDEWGWER